MDGDAMSTYQITYALEAYERVVKGENFLYDLTDEKETDIGGGSTGNTQNGNNNNTQTGGNGGADGNNFGDGDNSDSVNAGNPIKTGDEQNLLLWLAVLLTASIAACGTYQADTRRAVAGQKEDER